MYTIWICKRKKLFVRDVVINTNQLVPGLSPDSEPIVVRDKNVSIVHSQTAHIFDCGKGLLSRKSFSADITTKKIHGPHKMETIWGKSLVEHIRFLKQQSLRAGFLVFIKFRIGPRELHKTAFRVKPAELLNSFLRDLQLSIGFTQRK